MKKSKRFISSILTTAMIITNIVAPGNQITTLGAQYEVKHENLKEIEKGLEEDISNFVLGTQSKIVSYPIGGKVLEITSGWNSDRLNGVAKFKNGQSLFGKPEFTYSAFVYSSTDNERGSVFTVGNTNQYFSINPAPLALKYKGTGTGEITKLSNVKEMITGEWVRLMVSYEENETSGIVTVYIDGEEVISAEEIGFKLSALNTVDGYIGGTFFGTSYMGIGKYDHIIVTNEAFDGDISQDTIMVTSLIEEVERKLSYFSEETDNLDFSEKAEAETYIEQWLTKEFAEELSTGVTIRPHIIDFEPFGERYRESFEGKPGSMTLSLKVSAGNACAFTQDITCELKYNGELGEVPVYNSFSGVAQGIGDKEQSLWLDTDGVHIQAHGGQVQKTNIEGEDVWVWYGEDKTRNGNPIDGVNCYVSTDLYNWDNKGTVLRTHDIFPARLGNDGEFADKGVCLDEEAYVRLKKWAKMDVPTAEVSQEDIDMAKNFVEAYVDTSSDTGYDEESMKLAFWYMYTGYGIVERPKMLYNEVTEKYVIIYHQDGPDGSKLKECIEDGTFKNTSSRYSRASMGFAISDTPYGPFKLVNVQWMNGYPEQFSSKPGMARDMNVFIDDTDVDKNGVPDAYAIYSSEENAKLYISLLNADYTGPATQGAEDKMILEDGTEIQTFATRVLSDNSRESPAMFKYNNYYYMLTSGTTGWNPNPGIYYRAEHIYGPWTKMGDFCEGGSSNTFRSQNTAVIPYDLEAGLFIYMGDRWRTEKDSSALWYSSHVWLPIQITSDNKLEVKNVSDWNLDMLSQYASVIINTELPEQVVYGKTAALPEIVNVTIGNNTFDTAVLWEEPKALGTQTIKGTLVETGGKISFEAVVVIEDAVYFVDSGATSPDGREYFNLIRTLSEDTLENPDTPDQKYKAGSWGYQGDNTKARNGSFDMYELLRYVNGGTTGRDLIYSFDGLEEGEYAIYLGFFNPTSWTAASRVANISLHMNDEKVGVAEHKIADGVKDMVAFDKITASENSTLKVTISPKNSGSNTDVQISYIAVVKIADKDDIVLEQISIENLPDKTNYIIGEELDLTGIRVVAEYSDESRRVLNEDEYVIDDYDFSMTGKVEITVLHHMNEQEFKAKFFVTVYDPEELSDNSIAVVNNPEKMIYRVGETFDTDGMEVRLLRCVTSNNALPKEVITLEDSDYELEYDFDNAGQKNVEVIYSGLDGMGEEIILRTNIKVTIIDETLNYYPTQLKVKEKPYRSVYSVDEELDLTGIKVMVTNNVATPANASEAYTEEITDYEVEGYDASETGVQEIRIFMETINEEGEECILSDTFKIHVVKNKKQVIEDKIGAVDKQRENMFKDVDQDFILQEEKQAGLAKLYDIIKDILQANESEDITDRSARYLKKMENAVLEAFPQIKVAIDGEKVLIDSIDIYGTIWGADIDLSAGESQIIVISVNRTQSLDDNLNLNPGSKVTGIEISTKINDQETEFPDRVWIMMGIPEGHDQNSDVYCLVEGNDILKLTPFSNDNQIKLWINIPIIIGFVKEEPAAEVTLEKIDITKKPLKTKYNLGEVFEAKGMEITAYYSDDSSELVSGYTIDEYDFSTVGSKIITICYEGKNAYLNVDVIRKKNSTGGSESTSQAINMNPAAELNASLVGITGTVAGEWKKDDTGWWYALASGGYARNQWAQIGGVWYLFDLNGYMLTGWQHVSGKWYYLKIDGSMAVNETTPDGYLVGADGAWI